MKDTAEPLVGVGSLLTGITVASYVLGWVRLRSQHSAFGISWLTSEFPIVEVVSSGALPIVLLIVSTSVSWFLVSDLYEKAYAHILSVGLLSLALGAVAFGLSTHGYHAPAVSSGRVALILLSVAFCAAVGYATRKYGRTVLLSSKEGVSFLIALTFFYMIGTAVLGTIEGRKTRNPKSSDLPLVVVNSDSTRYRLVLAERSILYVARLKEDGEPQVWTLSPEKVDYISQSPLDTVDTE